MSIPEDFIRDWPDGPYWTTLEYEDDEDLDLVLLKRDTLDALITELREARDEA